MRAVRESQVTMERSRLETEGKRAGGMVVVFWGLRLRRLAAVEDRSVGNEFDVDREKKINIRTQVTPGKEA